MQIPPRFGVGFRRQHFEDLLAAPRAVDWLEILSDHHLDGGGARAAMLERLRGELPLALHGVSLNVASDAGPRPEYLARLRALADRIEPVFVSDHLCWTGLRGVESHDLLPVAYTREVLALVCERVARVQDALGRRLLLENASAYVAFRADEMGEATFFRELCARSGCGMLLDVNNLFVNAQNLGIDPSACLDALDPDHVGYLHLAGHTVLRDVRIDTHGTDVPDSVWDLYAEVVRRFPQAPVILERDDAIPSFGELVRELSRARALWRHAVRGHVDPPNGNSSAVTDIARAGEARVAHADWRSLQEDFWRRLVDKPPGFDHRASPGLDVLLDPTRPVGAARGLRVYSDAYGETGRRALTAHFRALARAIGEREFAALVAAYLAAHPSRSHDYVELGERFAEFVRNHRFESDFGVSQEALSEMAALEQAQLEVQEAADEEPGVAVRDLHRLSPEDWEGVRFRFVAACRLVFASHDVLPSIRAVARHEPLPRPPRAASAWLITRRGGTPFTDPIDPRGAEILAALAAGASFADACVSESADIERGVAALALAAARGALGELRIAPSRAARRDVPPGVGIEAACR
jgi:uncharacterized protein (UPF0276 family)